MNLEKAVKNLNFRGFKARTFESGAEAAAYICSSVSGTEVGIGGSKTVEALGLYEELSKNNTVYWHWKTPGPETLKSANAAPVYICSANGISEDGEILNIDGNGNRLAATGFAPGKKIYIVAGVNKLAPDFASALERARNVAAVKNAARFKKNTPCRIDGKCHNCNSPERICKGLLVLWAPMNNCEVEVLLINEELGY